MFEPLPLSLAAAGLEFAESGGAQDLRALMTGVRTAGFRSIQLSGTAKGVRARELDRPARRELAALLRRHELECSGLDLWIPPDHFVDARHVDRALEAALGAMELAADLARLVGGGSRPVTALTMPRPTPEAVLHELRNRADQVGCVLADCAWPPLGGAGEAAVRVGLDPAAVFGAGGDPIMETARLGPRLAQARLSDLASAGRVAPGSGRLKLMDYAASVIATGNAGAVVLDLRAVGSGAQQMQIAQRVEADWRGAFPAVG